MHKFVGVIGFAGLLLAAEGQTARSSFGGRLSLKESGCVFAPTAFLSPSWTSCEAFGEYEPKADGAWGFEMADVSPERKETLMNGTARFRLVGGAVEAAYSITPIRDLSLYILCVQAALPGATYFGGTVIGDDAPAVKIPVERKQMSVFSETVKKLKITGADARTSFTLTFPKPVSVWLQDNRQWNTPTLSLRIAFEKDAPYRAAKTYALQFQISEPQALTLQEARPFTITAGPDWIPLAVDPEVAAGSALDFSSVSGIEAPAGQYGYVVAKGPNFEFEKKPGVPQRFYGVNLCFTANFMTLEEARTLTRRLVRIGYNTVRIHHYDAGFTEGSPDGTTLNPKRMEQFDNLMAACIEAGLTVTTDLFVSRRVPYRAVGINRDGVIPMDEFKALVPIHEGAFENFKKFARLFLEHVNPLTHRRYAEEPALAFIALINEGNPGNGRGPYVDTPEWVAAWKTWLAARQAVDPSYADIHDRVPANFWNRDRAMAAYSVFLMEREMLFAQRTRAFLRDELKCRALLTNMSCWMNPVCYQLPREQCYDYVDDHFYVDHPQFLKEPWHLPSRCGNYNPVANSAYGAQEVVFRRLLDKPFTLTEYNYAGPGRFRGVGGIATGAAAALQNWSGLWRFAWSHHHDGALHPERETVGYFDMAGDPLSLAAERASICLFLRRDLAPLTKTYAMVLPEKAMRAFDGFSPINKTAWPWLSWYAQVGTMIADAAPAGATWAGTYPAVYKTSEAELRQQVGALPPMGDGALAIDSKLGTFTLRTPRTCGGFAEAGVITADTLTADIGETAATVWVSSLTAAPIATSPRLLLTHLTDVQNTNMRYADDSRQVLLAFGSLPHLMRNGRAAIRLRLDCAARYTVYALTTGGVRRRTIPSRIENGQLVFDAVVNADPAQATFLYEICREVKTQK